MASLAYDPLSLWVGNVPHGTSRDAVRGVLETLGISDILEVKVIRVL